MSREKTAKQVVLPLQTRKPSLAYSSDRPTHHRSYTFPSINGNLLILFSSFFTQTDTQASQDPNGGSMRDCLILFNYIGSFVQTHLARVTVSCCSIVADNPTAYGTYIPSSNLYFQFISNINFSTFDYSNLAVS